MNFRGRMQRRALSVGGLVVLTVLVTLLSPVWLLCVVIADVMHAPRTRPLTRLTLFGWAWCVTELAGVLAALGLWMIGRSRDHDAHYRLMAWWAGRLMAFMARALRIDMSVHGEESLNGGNAIVLCRHASLADSLVSAWVICSRNGIHPRYVLKRELLLDPCLDIVGLRVPNHFVNRGAADAASDLAALQHMAAGIDERTVAVIFPEGTRSSPAKRERAIAAIARRDPERSQRLTGLSHLLPVRPSGSAALLDGAPTADVILAWHTGFDGLDTFGGILQHLRSGSTSGQFVMRRVARNEVPENVAGWLDDQWLRMDREVASALGVEG